MFNLSEGIQAPAQESLQQYRNAILFVNLNDDKLNNTIRKSISSHYPIFSTSNPREAASLLDNIAVLCISCDGLCKDVLRLLAAVSYKEKKIVPCVILANAVDNGFLRTCRNMSSSIYAMPRTSASEDIIAILSNAAAHRDNKIAVDQSNPTGIEDIFQTRKLLDLIRDVALQDDLSAAFELVTESLPKLFHADNGYCLNYDAETHMLSGASPHRTVEFRQSVSAGLLRFVSLTGRLACVACLEEDPRYLSSVDDLGGGGEARLLACPVRDAQARVVAVIALVRMASKPAFSEQDENALSLLARYLSAPLGRFKLEAQLDEASRAPRDTTTIKTDAYRAEAVARYASNVENTGDVLHLSPGWTRWAYWLLLLCIGAALLYSTLTRVTEYANGPAVILFSGYIHGVVPVDCRARAAGQTNPTTASGILDARRPSLVAFIPGKYRPELQPGMNLRLKLSGFQYAYQRLTVDCVGEQVVSPAQVKRYLPADSAYTVSLSGPVVPVFVTLPSATFEAKGRRYAYYDGMGATAEAAVSSERLIYALVPGLKRWLAHNGG